MIAEFFYYIFEEMTKTEYGMFIYPEEGSYMWFPVSVSLLFSYSFPGQKKYTIYCNMKTIIIIM